eukprot:6199856-Pleurochrysis_carterae.AAC.3
MLRLPARYMARALPAPLEKDTCGEVGPRAAMLDLSEGAELSSICYAPAPRSSAADAQPSPIP